MLRSTCEKYSIFFLGVIKEKPLPNLVILHTKISRPIVGAKKTLVKFIARTRPKPSDIQSMASPLQHTAKASHTLCSLHLSNDSPKPEPLPFAKTYSPDFSLTLKFGLDVSQNVMKSQLV